MKTLFKTLILSVLLLNLSACKNNGAKQETQDAQKEDPSATTSENTGQAFISSEEIKGTVLGIAMGSPDHTTLVTAIKAADLENSLVNPGPLTVFAPTNAAFAALPEGTVESLLTAEKKPMLAHILIHHVTPGNYNKEFLEKFKKLGQASNLSIPVEVKGDDVYVGGAKIIASITASNGIVHVVDKVILPAE